MWSPKKLGATKTDSRGSMKFSSRLLLSATKFSAPRLCARRLRRLRKLRRLLSALFRRYFLYFFWSSEMSETSFRILRTSQSNIVQEFTSFRTSFPGFVFSQSPGCARFVLIVSSNGTFRQLFRNYPYKPLVCNQYWSDMVFFIHRLVAVFASRERLKHQMESSLFESRLSKIKLWSMRTSSSTRTRMSSN